mmetsp:Transcript_79544/g.238352  ORF Transcript_79544/g.238352 Transcript_79544/m.238352 type:complete len:234 (+) Transcript_79544:323-1024(+)
MAIIDSRQQRSVCRASQQSPGAKNGRRPIETLATHQARTRQFTSTSSSSSSSSCCVSHSKKGAACFAKSAPPPCPLDLSCSTRRWLASNSVFVSVRFLLRAASTLLVCVWYSLHFLRLARAAFSAASSSLLGLPPQRVACAVSSACFSYHAASDFSALAKRTASSAAAFSAVSVVNEAPASASSASSRTSLACRSAQNFFDTSSSACSASYKTSTILAASASALAPCGLTSHD